ncbi:hypothetical protein [Nonomuraea sp. NPDC049784]|uniref:hypothetical protein n=1 Tax=Nonomuraea sp. NPDC049784 TaxID=3154361 RepID=UPI0033DD2408
MAGDVLLPGEGARIAPTIFNEWLAGQRKSGRVKGRPSAIRAIATPNAQSPP